MSQKLTPKQALFVKEYLIDLNATQAAIRAGYSNKTARQIGEQNLSKLVIQNAIQEALAKRSERTEITADMVLQRLWSIATADPNELVKYRRVNCRYCWGEDHYYQWTTEVEFAKALETAKKLKRVKPDCDGGFGFDKTRVPHPDCPECKGEGEGSLHISDTSKLEGPARLLYAGAKHTREGLEIKTLDQLKALEMVSKHVGIGRDAIAVKQAELDARLKELEIEKREREAGAGDEDDLKGEYTLLKPDEDLPDAPVL